MIRTTQSCVNGKVIFRKPEIGMFVKIAIDGKPVRGINPDGVIRKPAYIYFIKGNKARVKYLYMGRLTGKSVPINELAPLMNEHEARILQSYLERN